MDGWMGRCSHFIEGTFKGRLRNGQSQGSYINKQGDCINLKSFLLLSPLNVKIVVTASVERDNTGRTNCKMVPPLQNMDMGEG